MSERWSELGRYLRIRLELLRVFLTIHRLSNGLIAYLVSLLLLKGAYYLQYCSSTVWVTGAGIVTLAAVGWIGIQFRDFLMSRRRTVEYLVDRDEAWEPLRAYLFRPDGVPTHPYFERALRQQVEDLGDTGRLFDVLAAKTRVKPLLVPFLLVALFGVMAIVPHQTADRPAGVPVNLSLSRQHVLAGDTVEINVRETPRSAKPSLKLSEENGDARTVNPEWTGEAWTWRSFPLQSSLNVEAVVNGRTSNARTVEVLEPPAVNMEISRVSPPDYTGLPDRDESGDPEVLPGSVVTVSVSANRPMERITVRDDEGNLTRDVRLRRSMTMTRRMTEERAFVVDAVDSHGFHADSVQRTVRIRPDAPPTVELRQPDVEQKVEGSGLLPVRVWFNDDFGLSGASLSYWSASAGTETRTIPVPDGQTEGELYGQIDRDALGLMTGDQFKFQVTVRDNDDVNGPKSSTIGPFTLRVYSWREMMSRRDDKRSEGVNRLSRMKKTVDKLRDELEQMARQQESADWEISRKLQKAQKSLKQQRKQLEQAQKNLQQYSQGGDGLSRESLKKLKDIQNMMREHGMKNLKKAQDSLSKAVKKQLKNQNLSSEDLEYSSEQLESFERDIERMHEYMKKAEPMMKMDKMSRTLQSMSEEQKQWGKESEFGERERRQLERQKEQWEWMKKQLEELKSKTSGKVKKQVQKMQKKLKQRNMASRAQEMLNQSSPGKKQRQSYKKKTQQLQQAMKMTLQQQSNQMAQKQRDLRSKLIDYWTEWYAELQAWGDHLDHMEVPPRFAGRFNTSMAPLNKAMEKNTDLRKGLAYLGQLTVQVGRMSTSFPREILHTIPEHTESLQETLDLIQRRRIRNARKRADNLMKNQARLVKKLLDWSPAQGSQSSQSSKPGQGGQSLSQLLKQQRRLMRGMRPLLGSKGVSKSLARQYLKQQQMIRRGLQKLARRQQQNESVLGDLKSITRDMKQAEKKMSEEEFDKTLKSKQETILKRMEQATKSLSSKEDNQKKTTEKRVATPGEGDTVPITYSDYQRVLERIKSDVSDLEPSEREAVLRFYRYWYQQRESEPDVP